MPINRKPGEKKDEFISRCIIKEVGSGMKEDQASAVCYTYWEDKQLSAIKNLRKVNEDKWIERFFEKNKIGTHISELGLKPEDFTDEFKFDVDVQKFLVYKDDATDSTVDYYRYETTVEGHTAQRPFCKTLMDQKEAGFLLSFEDIVGLNNASGKADRAGGGGYSVFKYRGGVHCKHKWVKYIYDTEKGELVRGKTQPPKGEVGYIKKR